MDSKPYLAIFRVAEGYSTFHLNHPTKDIMPGGNFESYDPAKITITSKGTIITEELAIGTGKARLQGQAIIDALKLTKAFKRGRVIDITDTDPLDPKQQERRRRDQELAEMQATRDDLEAAKAELELLKAQADGDPDAVKELKTTIKKMKDKEYLCPFCKKWKPKADAPAFQKKAGLASHMNGCKKRPSTNEDVEAARKQAEAAMPHVPDCHSDPRRMGDADPDIEAMAK